MKLTNFAEVHDALRPYYDYSRTPYNLDAPRQLLHWLGDPQEKVRVVHVAGTSGKTSTAYYASALLVADGKTAGLFVSPHVDEVNERLQINGQPLPEAEYCAVLSEFLTLLQNAPVKPSYFELVMALAYWEFARRGLYYAVMEVGLGGLLDATNVVTRADKICLITDIGLDHTEILGDSLPQIAYQKAGIIQSGNQVYMHAQPESVVSVIRSVAAKQQATLTVLEDNLAAVPSSLPAFQQRNLSLAVAALDSSQQAIKQAAAITIPARLEQCKIGSKLVIIDGAHNEQKLTTMIASLRQLYPNRSLSVLCSFVNGSQVRWQAGLEVLCKSAAQLVITSFQTEQDVPKSSVPVTELAAYCDALGYSNYIIEPDSKQALQILLHLDQQLVVVTGSFYLLNDIRPFIAQLAD